MSKAFSGKALARKQRVLTLGGIARRHPSGRLYEPGPRGRARARAERAEEVARVALAARRRVFRLGAEEARRTEAGTALGRLAISGEITRPQYEAAQRYEEVSRRADAALLARRMVSAAELDRSGGGGHDGRAGDDPAYAARCRAAVKEAERCWRAMAEAGAACRAAVDMAVLQGSATPAAVGDLRLGLNALARVFRMR
jgi:hypothetical protein